MSESSQQTVSSQPSNSIYRVLLTSNVVLIMILTTPLLVMTLYWLQYLNTSQVEAERLHVHAGVMAALKDRVDEASEYAIFMHKTLENRARQRIKSRVEEAHAIASALHAQYSGKLPAAEVKNLVREALRAIRFDEGRGYFFAGDYEGVQQIRADRPEMEGKLLLKIFDAPSRQAVLDMIDIARSEKAGFHEYRWSKPNSQGKEHRKLAYVMAFEPFGWFLGTGIYLDDVEAEIQQEVLERIGAIRWGEDGYLFVFKADGTYLQHSQKKFVGQQLLHIEDPKGVRINERLLETALSGGGFVDYVWDKYSKGELVPKVSYARSLKDWNWVIGAGAYLDDIEKNQAIATAETRKKLALTSLLFLIPVALSVMIAFRYARRFRDKLTLQIWPLLDFLAAQPGNRPPLTPDKGSFSELQTIVGAICELDRNWRESQQTLRKLSQVVEQNLSSIVITDDMSRIEYVNEAFVRNTGYSREEVFGKNPRMLSSGNTPPETYADLWLALSEKRPWKGVFYNRRKDGTEFVEFAILSPISGDDGVVTHYAAVKDDITEKMRMSEELERHRNRLEELVAARTTELVEARQMADTANQAKSAFLANMSHEIRTPMSGVLGVATLMRRGGVSPQQALYLDKIEASGRHLLSVINDILDLSKIEASKLQLDLHDFELSALIGDVEAIVRDRIEQKGLRFSIDLASVPQRLHGDSNRLAQALVNLLNNAAKFTEQGEISLRCRCISEDQASCLLRFDVSDTGIGIDPKNRQRLFNAFEQEDSTTSRRFGGTGLGLAITARLVELMGGEVGVDSTPGQGSTFWLTVPLKFAQMAGAQPTESGAPDAEAALRCEYSGTRVLLVEDEPTNAELALILLGDVGLITDHAADGRQALELAKANEYGLILMDMQLPEMNGLEATRAIRALPHRKLIPVIALTANAFNEDREVCLAAGMNDFLTKPYMPETLFSKALQWLRASK